MSFPSKRPRFWLPALGVLLLTGQPLVGQAPGTDQAEPGATVGEKAAAERDTAQRVTALDIFYACRHTEAFDSANALARFCSLRLPSRRDSAAVARRWAADARAVNRRVILGRREAVRNAQQRRRTSAGGFRSSDLGGGEIVFAGQDNGLQPALIQGLGQVRREIQRFHDSLGISQVEVIAYGSSDSELLRERARIVANSVTSDLAVVPSRTDSITDDSALQGRVSIHVQLPVIPAGTFRSLQTIPFEPGSVDLNDGARLQIASAAEAILNHREYRNGAIVEVPWVDYKTIGSARRDAVIAALLEAGVKQEQIRPRERSPDLRSEGTVASSQHQGGLLTLGDHGGSESRLAARQTGSTAEFALGWEAIAQAATDALVERATRELQQYVLVSFGTKLCSGDARELFLDSCTLLLDTKQYAPGLETLRNVVRSDAEALPERAVATLLSRQFSTLSDQAAVDSLRQNRDSYASRLSPPGGGEARADSRTLRRYEQELESAQTALDHAEAALSIRTTSLGPYAERAVLALYAFHFARRVHRGEDPVEILIGFPVWRQEFAGGSAGLAYVASTPSVQRMEQLAGFVATARNTAEDLRMLSGGSIAADTIYRYAALQLAANASDDAPLLRRLHQVLEVQRRIEADLASLDTIRSQLASLRQKGDSAAAQRRELYGQAVEAFVRTAMAEMHLGDGLSHQDSVGRLQRTISDLILAIQTRAYRNVLQSSLVLLQGLAPADSMSCKTACPALLRENVRLLALAADMSEAQSQDELRQAMSRFVNEGGSSNEKRSDAKPGTVYLNAHVGAGGGVRQGASPDYMLRLPVGAEIVLGQPWKRWPQFTVFVQAIDLAGFLPQSGDEPDRTNDQRLAGVINPGALLMMSIGKNTPFSFGFGATPNRVIENEEWRTRVRGVVHFGIDLPLMRLY